MYMYVAGFPCLGQGHTVIEMEQANKQQCPPFCNQYYEKGKYT